MNSYDIDMLIKSFLVDDNNRIAVDERSFETDKSFIIELELAGVKKENITLDIDGDTLKVSAIKKTTLIDGSKIIFGSRKSGKVEKVYQLKSSIDRDNISAELIDGVLSITLNKKEISTKRTVTIK